MAPKYRTLPELRPGIRIQYKDNEGATRSGYIHARRGTMLSVKLPAKGMFQPEAQRIPVEQVIGYWPPRVKACPKRMILIRKGVSDASKKS